MKTKPLVPKEVEGAIALLTNNYADTLALSRHMLAYSKTHESSEAVAVVELTLLLARKEEVTRAAEQTIYDWIHGDNNIVDVQISKLIWEQKWSKKERVLLLVPLIPNEDIFPLNDLKYSLGMED